MKPIVCLIFILTVMFLFETNLAQPKDGMMCECIDEAENGDFDRNVGHYHVTMMTGGSGDRCNSVLIRTYENNSDHDRRHLSGDALEKRQDYRGKGIQSFSFFKWDVRSKEKDADLVKGMHFKFSKKRYFSVEDNKMGSMVSIVAQDDDLDTGYLLLFYCVVTDGRKFLKLMTKQPDPHESVIKMAKKKAKKLGVEFSSVKHDDDCNYNKIWNKLQSK